MIMDRCYLHCNMNSLDLSICRRRQPISTPRWRFILRKTMLSSRWGVEIEVSLFIWGNVYHDSHSFIFWQISCNTFTPTFGDRFCQHAPLGLPILRLLVFCPLRGSQQGKMQCFMFKMKRGVMRRHWMHGDCVWLLCSEGLFSCLFGAYHLLLVCLIINNAVSTLPTQQIPKWRQPALQIFRMRKQPEAFDEDAFLWGQCLQICVFLSE